MWWIGRVLQRLTLDEARDIAQRTATVDELGLDELRRRDVGLRGEGDARVTARGVERPHLPRLGGRETAERETRPVGGDDQVLAHALDVTLAHRPAVDPPADLRIAVLVDGPRLHAAVSGGAGELDVPAGAIDRLARTGLRIERREPQVLLVDVGDLEDAAVGEPARGHVRDVLRVLRDLRRVAAVRFDDHEDLWRVVVLSSRDDPPAVG